MGDTCAVLGFDWGTAGAKKAAHPPKKKGPLFILRAEFPVGSQRVRLKALRTLMGVYGKSDGQFPGSGSVAPGQKNR